MSDSATPPIEELRFYRLLVAIDDSGHSDFVLAASATAARHNNSRLTLISVAAKVPSATRWGAAVINSEQLQAESDAATQRLLRAAAARLPNDVLATTLFRRGKAGAEILAEIRRGDYDAVLMGARGTGRVQALLGSVSQYVLRNADIAVVVVHAPASALIGSP